MNWREWGATERAMKGIEYLGGITLLCRDMGRVILLPPFERDLVIYQMDLLGAKSFSIVLITAVFIGMVLAIQTAYTLAAFGAKLYVGQVVSLSMVRELGPVLISLMVGGRVGAGITAEIGSMKVTEQIDALRALGADPVKKLVVPRMVAFLIMLPMLVMLADALGIMGGLLISSLELNISSRFYLSAVFKILKLQDVFSGLGKTLFFAFFICIIACFNGFRTEGGADGVGRATTNTVVLSSITVLISDFFLTKIFLAF